MAAGSLQGANEKVKLPERVILWDETEVVKKQVNQVGTSACGATAVLNVLVRSVRQDGTSKRLENLFQLVKIIKLKQLQQTSGRLKLISMSSRRE